MDLKEIEEIQKSMRQVPFGQSEFQNRTMTDGHETPERRFRFVLLQLQTKLQALQGARFARDRILIDIEEIELKIAPLFKSSIERRRLEIDLAEKVSALEFQDKLIEDALIEATGFYNEYKSLPPVTRLGFESSENKYWSERLSADATRQLKCTGTVNPDTLRELNKLNLDVKVNNGAAFIAPLKKIELVEEQNNA